MLDPNGLLGAFRSLVISRDSVVNISTAGRPSILMVIIAKFA